MSSVADAERRAERILGEILGTRTEVKLGDFTSEFEKALEHSTTTRFTAQLLRRRGFKRGELEGHGYNRQPVYRRAP